MRRREELSLRAREAQATVEQALLNRALRHNKSRIDQAVTRLVMTKLPEISDDQVGGGPAQRGRLDAPPKPTA